MINNVLRYIWFSELPLPIGQKVGNIGKAFYILFRRILGGKELSKIEPWEINSAVYNR